MRQLLRTAGVAVSAFALGAFVTHLPLPVRAAAPPLQPAAIDLLAVSPDSLTPSPVFPTLRQKTYVVTDGMTAALSMGGAPKHYHANANEIQLIIDGTGTEWLGDKQVDLKPGMLIIIPTNTVHAGIVDTSGGRLRLVAFKTPPQAPDDYHAVK
jgi:mannose-6-phosphate isomerase-like protein (cupin superfamily)